jgi:hypothetical protein
MLMKTKRLCAAAVLRHHLADLHRALDAEIARGDIPGGRARAGRRVDREEPAIHPALHHARVIDLIAIRIGDVPVHDAPAGAAEIGRGVEMRVQHDQLFMDRARRVGDGLLGDDGTGRTESERRASAERHHVSSSSIQHSATLFCLQVQH